MRKFREMIFSGGNKGFTLIELLVVIAVLGILAGIAVPRMMGITDQAKVARAEADMRTAQTAIEMYYAETESYPTGSSATLGALGIDDYIDTTDIETPITYTKNTTGYTISTTVPGVSDIVRD